MNATRIVLNVGSLVLVAVLGWLIVRIGLGVAQPESLYAPEAIVAPVQTTSVAAASVAYDFSTDPFAFGEAEVVDVQLELLEDAPETTLNLKLIGIVSESNATFRLTNGKDEAVEVGDEVMNGVTLTRTAKDFVTLDVNGETQKLTMERVKLGEKDNAPKIIRATPAAAAGTDQTGKASALPTSADVEDLFSKVQLRPEFEIQANGSRSIAGYKIIAKPGANLNQFKLQSGDVLTRVGPTLLNTGKLPNQKQLLNLLSTGAAQDFEVIRNGSPVTIRIGQ